MYDLCTMRVNVIETIYLKRNYRLVLRFNRVFNYKIHKLITIHIYYVILLLTLVKYFSVICLYFHWMYNGFYCQMHRSRPFFFFYCKFYLRIIGCNMSLWNGPMILASFIQSVSYRSLGCIIYK